MDTQSPTLDALQSKISTLADLHSKIQSIRAIPPLILRPPPPPFTPPLQDLKDFAQTLKSDGVQAALRAAAESEKEDSKGLRIGGRREIRKRRYALIHLKSEYFDSNEDDLDDCRLHNHLSHIAPFPMINKVTQIAPCSQLTHHCPQLQSRRFLHTSANLINPTRRFLNFTSISEIPYRRKMTMRWRP
jgi:hypothetical protein